MGEVTVKLPNWEMNVFEVYGTNPKTKRKKSETVVIVGDDREKAKQKSNLIDIISVELIEQEPPSNAQIKYGNDLGIEYKSYYTKHDYSALISIADKEEEYIPIDKGAADFAADHGIYLSQYASMTRLYRYYYHDLSLPETAAFFAFTVYQSINGFVCYDYLKHPKYDLFKKFSDENINNGEFTNSLLKYDNTDEFIPKHGVLRQTTNAYKICYGYLIENGEALPINKSSVIINHKEKTVADLDNAVPNMIEASKLSLPIVCDKCGTENLKGQIRCKKCQSKLYQNIECPRCHTENNHNNYSCSKCKYELKVDPEIKKKEKRKKELRTMLIGILAVVALLVFILFACSRPSKVSEIKKNEDSTIEVTGDSGLTIEKVEQYFYKNIPDLRFVNCSIRDDGTYSVSCTLSDEKSERKYNYDDFALAVKSACDNFSKTYSTQAKIFTIFFYQNDSGRVYWQSLDGKNGTLYENYGDYYNHEEKYTFDELVSFYSEK